jgi:hypothetical protein
MFCWLVYALASCRGAASPWIWTLLLTELEAGDSGSEPEDVLITGTSAGFSHLVGNVSAIQSVHLGNSFRDGINNLAPGTPLRHAAVTSVI